MTDHAPLPTSVDGPHEGSRFGADLHDLFADARQEQLGDGFLRLGDLAPKVVGPADESAETKMHMAIADARYAKDLGFFATIIGDPEDERPLLERAPQTLRVPLEAFLAESHGRGEVENAARVLDGIISAARPNFDLIVRNAPELAGVKASLRMGATATNRQPATDQEAIVKADSIAEDDVALRAHFGAFSASFNRGTQMRADAERERTATAPAPETPERTATPQKTARAFGVARVIYRGGQSAIQEATVLTPIVPSRAPTVRATAKVAPANYAGRNKPGVRSHRVRPPITARVSDRVSGIANGIRRRLTPSRG